MTDNRTLSEQYAEIAAQWADYEHTASIKEDTKSSFLSNLIQDRLLRGETAYNKAEMAVKASREWVAYIEETVEARRLANLWKVKKEVLWMRHSEQMSNAANERLVAKL